MIFCTVIVTLLIIKIKKLILGVKEDPVKGHQYMYMYIRTYICRSMVKYGYIRI